MEEAVDKLLSIMETTRNLAKNAYAPYSNFRVGCTVETHAGNFFSGCNVENISFGLTCCAERNAIFQAVAVEGPTMRLKVIYIAMADGKEGGPCGACRQVINEFAQDAKVMFVQGGKIVETTPEQLLPYGFNRL